MFAVTVPLTVEVPDVVTDPEIGSVMPLAPRLTSSRPTTSDAGSSALTALIEASIVLCSAAVAGAAMIFARMLVSVPEAVDVLVSIVARWPVSSAGAAGCLARIAAAVVSVAAPVGSALDETTTEGVKLTVVSTTVLPPCRATDTLQAGKSPGPTAQGRTREGHSAR